MDGENHMNDINIINQELGTNYNNLSEIYSLKDALTVCLKDERLYRQVCYFTPDTWTNENQEIFANILEDYMKKIGYNPKIKRITNQQLLTNAYLYGMNVNGRLTVEALNEENIKLALEKNNFDTFLFRDNPLVLKVYLENNYNVNIEFRTQVWNEENANLYIQNMSDFPKISSFYTNVICLKEVIRNHKFELINNFSISSSIVLDSEIGELLYQKMVEFKEDIVEIKIYLFNGLEPYYLKGLIATKRFDLVESALSNKALTEENIILLSENINQYLNVTSGKLNFSLTKSNHILHKLIELKKVDIINNAFYGDVWTEENIKSYFDLNLDKKYYDRFRYNSLALKVYITGDYKLDIPFTNFNDEIVWTEENIELYFGFLKRVNPDEINYSKFANFM